jgi:two-component system, LytTR family, sensor kinase
MKRYGRQISYLLFGALFFLFWLLFKIGGMPVLSTALLSTAIDVAITMGALLVTAELLLPRLVYRKRIGLFFACFLLLVLVAGTVIILSQLRLLGRSLSSYQQDLARYQAHYFYWFWADLVFGSYFMVFFIASAGAAVRLAMARMEAQSQVQRLQKEQALSELERLKHQVNPHFLFNALNTVYYKIDWANGPARETLQRFSNMLRYQLYECDKPLVELEAELAFILAYIDLQKERMNDNYSITCMGMDGVKGFLIAPFLMMPLIENCFKHVSAHPGESGRKNTIEIVFIMDGAIFRLRTINSIDRCSGDGPARNGIGLDNVRRRLSLLYPGRHSLVTGESEYGYETMLELDLNETRDAITMYHS